MRFAAAARSGVLSTSTVRPHRILYVTYFGGSFGGGADGVTFPV